MDFLQLVAKDLYTRCSGDLRQVTVVFPNRRAGVFLDRWLYQEAGQRALWSPRYITISDLFSELSPLMLNDPIDTVCRLYEHYVASTGDHDTTLDRFYGWGERLLSDFNDIDKSITDDNLVRQLFANITDIKELDTLDYLSPEQTEVLQRFFHDFSTDNNSEIRQRFLILWQQMYNIYQRLNAELRAEGRAYEGALFRDVVREGYAARKNQGIYVFVGHNALSNIEKELLRQLQREQRAWFYWDYDASYLTPSQEASYFLRDNLREFPNLLPESAFDNLRHVESIEFVSASTENVQARSITPWISRHIGSDPTRTAVVLASEGQLLPVLHSLPAEVENVNVTKGFPVNHTQAYAFVEHYFAGALEGRSATDNRQVIIDLQEKIKAQMVGAEEEEFSMEQLLATEAWYYTFTLLGRFLNLVDSGRLAGVSAITLHKLIKQNLRQLSVPFEGEPAIGIQIMGMLETRCLDFDNVLILSANEKTLPRVSADNSFIPYSLRKAFGLTVINHRTAVYAYYFYRLLQRAKHVRCIYNSSTEGTRTGEMSRFMTQLMVESKLPIRHVVLKTAPNIPARALEAVEKPADIAEQVKSLSPSAINCYLDCQKKFYYQRIKGLKKPEDPADVIAETTFGLLFHKAAELIFRDLSNGGQKPITASAIRALYEDRASLWHYINQAFGQTEPHVDFNGVIAEVLQQYLERMLKYDAEVIGNGEMRIIGLEQKHHFFLPVTCRDGQVRSIRVGGDIDRLDEVTIDGVKTCRVVDYKTGGSTERLESSKDLSPLFTPSDKRPHYLLQTFLYSLAVLRGQQTTDKGRQQTRDGNRQQTEDNYQLSTVNCQLSTPVAPALYFVNHILKDSLIKVEKKPLTDFRPLEQTYIEGLSALIAEILDPIVPFSPRAEHCARCPFYLLCHA